MMLTIRNIKQFNPKISIPFPIINKSKLIVPLTERLRTMYGSRKGSRSWSRTNSTRNSYIN